MAMPPKNVIEAGNRHLKQLQVMLQEAKVKLSSLEAHAYTQLLRLSGFLGTYFAACSRGIFQCSRCYRRLILPGKSVTAAALLVAAITMHID